MANKKGHRRFGSVRQLPSKRWQARYLGPDGIEHPAPHTFPTRRDAERWLSVIETEILSGDWLDPDLGKVNLGEFGRACIAERKVSKRVRDEDASLWRLHVEPRLGRFQVNEVTPDVIRKWRVWLLDHGRSEDRTAKAYRLVRLIFNIALADGRVKRNPCQIKGADQHRTPERPHASVDEVYALADKMPARYRFLVLLAGFSGLRWGELIALQRRDFDPVTMKVRVARATAQHSDGELAIRPTKSLASVRRVSLPAFLRDELLTHLSEFAQPGKSGLLFVGKKGGQLRRGNFHRETSWTTTVVDAGLPKGFHFHDLRHTGNQMAAELGATTRELMVRMGHSTSRAALIYQHATGERDRQIAELLNARVEEQRKAAAKDDGEPDEGAAGVLVPAG